MDLQELKFVVVTDDLDKAAKKIEALGTAVSELNAPLKKLSTNTDKLSESNNKLAKSTEKRVKAEESAGASASKADKLLEKLNNRYTDMAKGSTSAEAGILQLARSLGATTEDALKPYKDILENIRSLSKSPFDSAIGSVRSITQEYDAMTNRAELAAKGIFLTTQQLKEYSKISNEIKGKVIAADLDPTKGEGLAKFNSELKAQQDLYLGIANKVNTLKAAEKDRNDILNQQMKEQARLQEASDNLFKFNQLRHAQDQKGYEQDMAALRKYYVEMEKTAKISQPSGGYMDNAVEAFYKAQTKAKNAAAKATQYITDADARLAAALDVTNAKLDKQASDAFVKYEKALRQSGKSAEEVAAKLAVAKTQFEAIADKKQADKLQYLARAISVQMGDVGISLASGMNPLLVMIQQGDQIRGAIQQAGASGKELEKAMSNAAVQIATSFAQTGQAIGGFFVSAIKGAGKSVTEFAMNITGTEQVLEKLRYNIALMQGSDGNLMKMFKGAAAGIEILAGVIALGLVGSLVMLGKGLYDVIKQEDALTTQLVLTGASLGVNTVAATSYAESLNSVGVTTSSALKVMQAMAKEGGFVANEINMVAVATNNLKFAGIAIEDTVKQFAKLKEKPVEALLEVAKTTGMVAPEISKLVYELVEQGKTSDAAAIAMKAYADVTVRQKDRLKNELSDFAIFIKSLSSNVSEFFDEVFRGLWRKTSPTEAIKRQIKDVENTIRLGTEASPETKAANDAKLTALKEQLRLSQQAVDSDQTRLSDQARLNKTYEQFVKDSSQFASNEMKRKKELAEAENNYQSLLKAGLITRVQYETLLQNIRNKYKDEKGPAISVPASKDLSIIQKDFNRELKLAESFAKDERDLLKARFDAGLMDRAEYVSKDVALLQQSEQKQLDVIDQFSAKYNKAFGDQAQLLTDALGKTKDPENRKKLIEDITNLAKDFMEFNDTVDDTKAKLASAFSTREQISMLSFEKAAKASTDALKEYIKTQDDAAENKRIDLELSDRLTNAYGVDAVRIKAIADETKRQTAEISKFTIAQAEARKAYQAALDDPNASGATRGAAYTAYTTAMENANKAIARSKLEIAQAGIDAEVFYYKQEYDRISKGVADAIETALYEGGKAGRKKLRDLIVDELKKPITIVVKALVDATLGSFAQGAIGSAGGSAAGSFSGSAAGSAFGNAVGSMSIGGTTVSTMGEAYMAGIKASAAGGDAAIAAQGGNLAGQAGYYSGTAAGSIAGMYANRTISNGYKVNSTVSTIQDITTVVASFLGGPLGGILEGVYSGLFNRTFGRKLAGVGVEGTLGGQTGFEGNRYTFEKGGFLRKDKTIKSALEEADRSAIASDYRLIKTSMIEMADAAGFGSEAIDKFTQKFAIDLMNLSPEEAIKKYREEFAKVEESMAKAVIGTSGYRRENETNVQALTRLSTFMTGINGAFEKLGFNTYKLELSSIDAAQAFVDLFGGIEGFNKAFTFFYDNFFTAEEKTSYLAEDLTKSFGKLNLSLPKTREEFKQMVLAAQKAGDATLVKNLTDLQYAFAELVPAADDAASSIEDLIKRISDPLKEMLSKFVELTGTPAEFQAYKRNEIMQQTDPALKSIQAYLFALEDVKTTSEDVTKAQDELEKAETNLKNARADALKGMIDTTKNFIDSLRKFSQSLLLGAQSTLTPEQKYTESRKQLENLLKIATSSATTPEEIAIRDNALSSLEGAASSFLEASRVYNASSSQYTQDFEFVQKAISQTADALTAQVSDAEKQLKALGSIDSGISAVEKAINDLASAQAAVADAQIAFNKALEASLGLRPAATQAYSSANAVVNKQASFENGMIYGKNGSSISSTEALGFINNYVSNINAGTEGFTAKDLYNKLTEWGVSSDLLASLTGYSKSAILQWFQGLDSSIPAFAKGTNFVPSDMYAEVHKGERIIPAADNARLMQSLNNRNETNAILVTEIKNLRQEIVELRNQQSKETATIVISNIDAQQKNAERVGEVISKTSQESNWNAKVRETVKLK